MRWGGGLERGRRRRRSRRRWGGRLGRVIPPSFAALHPVLALLGLVVGWVIYNTAGFSSRSESRAGEKTNINKAGKNSLKTILSFENNVPQYTNAPSNMIYFNITYIEH